MSARSKPSPKELVADDIYFAVEHHPVAGHFELQGFQVYRGSEDGLLARHALRSVLKSKGMNGPNRQAFAYCLVRTRASDAEEFEERLGSDPGVYCYARLSRATANRRFLRAVT